MIQPHLPIRLPCYDFTPITGPTFGRALLAVRLRTSGVPDSHGVTGGVYKARERQFQLHAGELQPAIRTETVFGDLLRLAVSLPFVDGHCITCVAQDIRGMMI